MEAKEYKQRLGDRARDIIAYGLGLDKYRPSKNEALCPFHRETTPSFKWDSKRYTWKCFGCGETLDIYRYLTEFKHLSFPEAAREVANMTGGDVKVTTHRPVAEYQKPNIETCDLSQEAIQYMASRKISFQTLNDWKVRQRTWNGKECYVFQYFDENNDLHFVSFREIREGGLKGGCERNTKPILWGMWHIDKKKPVIITEGQLDAMSVWEAGYRNVVSVPSGSNNLTWIDHCWDWLQDVVEFIVWADNDPPGRKMAHELQVRLGKYKTKVIIHERKDANEVLCLEGKEAVLEFIINAIRQTPAGIINMSQVDYVGVKNKVDEGIPTGFYQLDSTIEDLQPEQVTVLVGRNGEGKSTVVSQMICNSINNKIPVFLYSGEMSTQRILNWLFRQAIGNDKEYLEFVETKYRLKADIKPRALKALRQWAADLFFTFDKSVANVRENTSDLFEVMSIAARRYGCKLFIIDNLMSALEDTADSINADQSNFVQRCKDFAENYHVHLILVTHPNKAKGRGEKLEKEDISGSNNIPNKADIIISIERQFKDDRDCDAKLRLLKDREEGRFVEVKLIFQETTKRFLELEGDKVRPINYNWRHYLEDADWYEVDIEEKDLPF